MKKSHSFKGIWIPRNILELPDLNLRQVLILSDIAALSTNGRKYFKGNKTIAREFRTSASTVKRDLIHLEGLNLISRAHLDGVRFIYSTSKLNSKTTEGHEIINGGQCNQEVGSSRPSSNTRNKTVMSTIQREQIDGKRFNAFLNDEDLNFAMSAWIEHLQQLGKPLSRNSINQTWLALFQNSKGNAVSAFQTIQHSISQNWKSLHPAPNPKRQNGALQLDLERAVEWANGDS